MDSPRWLPPFGMRIDRRTTNSMETHSSRRSRPGSGTQRPAIEPPDFRLEVMALCQVGRGRSALRHHRACRRYRREGVAFETRRYRVAASLL